MTAGERLEVSIPWPYDGTRCEGCAHLGRQHGALRQEDWFGGAFYFVPSKCQALNCKCERMQARTCEMHVDRPAVRVDEEGCGACLECAVAYAPYFARQRERTPDATALGVPANVTYLPGAEPECATPPCDVCEDEPWHIALPSGGRVCGGCYIADGGDGSLIPATEGSAP